MRELLAIIVVLLIYIAIQLSVQPTEKSNVSVSVVEKRNDKVKLSSQDKTEILLKQEPIDIEHTINDIPSRRNYVTHPPSSIRQHVPINIQTRGPSEEYRQLGVLANGDNSNILPLYGRRLYNGASNWNYYTQTDRFVSVNLPVFNAKKDCSAEYGCSELTDGDEVTVPQYSETYKVTLYHLDGPRYIPYL